MGATNIENVTELTNKIEKKNRPPLWGDLCKHLKD